MAPSFSSEVKHDSYNNSMKSKANIKGHPLHPILVSFPIAFFIGALVFDILGITYERDDFHRTAVFLATGGIGAALLAAVPGIIDSWYTVPPESTGRKRATKHALTNITVVILFSLALWLRHENTSLWTITGLEAVAVVLLMIAGWMGGTLVYRNQIGVDPRYAHAGKWKEEHIEVSDGPVRVAGTNELKVNQMKLLRVGNKRMVVCRTEKGYAVIDDRCTHRGGSLAGGALICGTVQCPWHGSQFDVHDGTVKAGPAEEKIRSYPVTESQDGVYVSFGKDK
jgi:uncharacterized membrane protein/nitrite reductase/ring-hydroxylating ferredoxin subunit